MKNSRYKYKRTSLQFPEEFTNWLKSQLQVGEMMNYYVMEKMGYLDYKSTEKKEI